MKKILLTLSFILLVGCGYKPSAHYIKNVIDGSIYVSIIVDAKEPENAAYIKDALHQMILTRFKGSLASKETAQNFIVASYEGTSFTPISSHFFDIEVSILQKAVLDSLPFFTIPILSLFFGFLPIGFERMQFSFNGKSITAK